MKKILVLFVGLFMTVCANAQLSRSVSEQLHTHLEEYEYVPTGKYNRFYIGYKSKTTNIEMNELEDLSVKNPGFMFGWTHGRPLSIGSLPLSWEIGVSAAIGYDGGTSSYGEDYDDIESGFQGILVPLNLSYRLDLGNRLYVSPYIGVYAGYLDIWVYNWDGESLDCCNDEFDYGMKLGVNLDYKKVHVGLSWQPSFCSFGSNEEVKSASMHDINISVGFIFHRTKKVRKN